MHAYVTGIGLVSPYGPGRELLWDQAVQGVCAFRPVQRFDASPYRNELGGEVPDVDPGEEERATAYAVAAAREALADAGCDTAAGRVGLVLGTNFGGMECAESAFAKRKNGDALQPLNAYPPAYTLRAVREVIGGVGPQCALSLSCASGAAAIATALEWIRAGRADVVLAGGFDELSETAFAGLSALRAITKDTVRPWDVNRGGTLFSEGAGVLVIESETFALARGADVYARLLGRGLNNDAFHMTAPEKEGKGIVVVMRMALADAGVDAHDVAHLNCHGTGTKYNDMIETTAIRTVFGAHADDMRFTANKSLFGHTMGAAGAIEAAITCLSVKHNNIPPTVNTEEPDPDLPLDLCFGKAWQGDVPLALTNSYGLGGTNASLVFGKA